MKKNGLFILIPTSPVWIIICPASYLVRYLWIILTNSGCVGLHETVRCSYKILTKTGFLLCILGSSSSHCIQQRPSRRKYFPFIQTDKHIVILMIITKLPRQQFCMYNTHTSGEVCLTGSEIVSNRPRNSLSNKPQHADISLDQLYCTAIGNIGPYALCHNCAWSRYNRGQPCGIKKYAYQWD